MTQSWRVPALRNGIVVPAGPIYEALEFPLPLDKLAAHNDRTETEGDRLVLWAAETEPLRVPAFLEFLAAAGAPIAGPPASAAEVERLDHWVTRWFPYVVAPWLGDVWELGTLRQMEFFGSEAALPFRTLMHSLACDLGFLVIAGARMIRPELKWSLCRDISIVFRRHGQEPHRFFTPTISPTAVPDDVFAEPEGLLASAARNPPGSLGPPPLERIGPPPLVALYQQLLKPTLPTPSPASPHAQVEYRGYPPRLLTRHRFRVRIPGPRSAPPEPTVLAAVDAIRRAGWFASFRDWSTPELAGALRAAWKRTEEEELATEAPLLDFQLIDLDEDRTLTFDPEADACDGAMVYRAVLNGLADRSRGFLKVTRVKEDWKVEPGSVRVSFFRGDQRIQFSVPDDGDWIDPGVVLAVNELLPPEGPRFYFVDNGGANHAAITRATEYERFLLEATRPISLDSEPPRWWLSVRDT